MAGSMADYLDIAVPDYGTETLFLAPQDTMPEAASKNQIVHELDDGDMEVISLSDEPQFTVTLQWDVLSLADSDALMDYWLSPAKANGYARSFKWSHPLDGHVYVARFASDITRTLRTANLAGVASLKLRIEGVVS
jgi:hypothetical protein